MQVDPVKPTLKAPGIKLLKLECDKPLSNFAFKFNLRRYIKAIDREMLAFLSRYGKLRHLHPGSNRACFHRLKLKFAIAAEI